ncbi:MAG: ACP phosphodiesterase [Blastocatellia bacterium]|nr:ACP phosphodiesterase [Blastocatellia bacterium]
MNYLAHLYLADNTPESLLGNLLGDFVKGSLDGTTYAPEIQRGIERHRSVDGFTDSHEIVRLSKNRISPTRRRYAGIIIDMAYDHFLARHWDDYTSTPLPEFSARIYTVLLDNRQILPPRLQSILPSLVQDDWLTSYREFAALNRALNRISLRLKRENTLFNAAEEVKSEYAHLERDFRTFFPQLVEHVKTLSR